MIRVYVVDDHTLVRQSLVDLVDDADDLEICGQAGSVEDARLRVLADPPDIIVLDVSLPGADGLDFAAEIGEGETNTRVMMLTMHDDARSLRRATEAGVAGYLTKSATQHELLTGIRSIAAGGSYLSPSVAGLMMDVARGSSVLERLTDRETLILQMLAGGMRVREIAAELVLSDKTVKNHLCHIYTKLDVESGAQAVVAAYRRGLVHV